MKVLICGMTASQSSQALSRRNFSFAGSIDYALTKDGHEVVWADPSVLWTKKDFDEYDVVLAGVAPMLSMTANKTYGILALIATLYGSKKLRLFVDAPEPTKIHASLRSIDKENSRLVKQLYSSRKEFKEVTQNKKSKDKVLAGAKILLSEKWQKTIYPKLPVDQCVSDSPGIPESMSSSFSGVNLDSIFIEDGMALKNRQNYWIVGNTKAKWCIDTAEHLMYPTDVAKESRTWTDEHVVEKVSNSLGVLIGPHNDKLLWWSPLFIQAMNALTPIATEWRISSAIGKDWNHLAAGIEEMSALDRYEIAVAQREQYVNVVRNPVHAVNHLKGEIGI